MTPYYDRAGITIYCGDMRELLLALDLRDVGCVVADPPYAETSCDWDRWPDGWPNTIRSSLVPINAPLWCFGSFRMFLDRAADFVGWQLAQDLVWEKHNGSGFAADRFKRVHEHVVRGTINRAGVLPGDIFRPVLLSGAASLILAHNHPSGDTTASPEDIAFTRAVVQAGKMLGVDLLDHVIVGDSGVFSFRDHGFF